jgi:hypothetical protein
MNVLPLEALDLTGAKPAEEVENRRHVRKEPVSIGFRHLEEARLLGIGQGLAGWWSYALKPSRPA